MNKVELLAPAGDFERLKWAFLYGADAVYIGGLEFGLRANATNFSLPQIKRAVLYAHRLNKKVYVTVNIALHNQETKKVLAYLFELEKLKVDAIIVSDLYVLQLANKKTKLKVFVSTQAATFNYQAATFLHEMGASRIILARELYKNDIKEIIKKSKLEIEVFIHGAICASISGRCALSNYLTNRDANRGGCSQVCRWYFELTDQKSFSKKDFSLSTKDLIMVDHLKEMIEMGISSLKIEGRMRSIYYLATVVSIYRRIIDGIYQNNNYDINQKDLKDLKRVANRQLISQFFEKGFEKDYQYYGERDEDANQDFLAIVLKYDKKTKLALVEQRNYFTKDDQVEFFGPNLMPKPFKIKAIFNEEKETIEVVRHPKQKVYLLTDKVLTKNQIIRKII